MILFLAAVFVLTEGVGLGRTMAVVDRRYRDPVTADIITRSGRRRAALKERRLGTLRRQTGIARRTLSGEWDDIPGQGI